MTKHTIRLATRISLVFALLLAAGTLLNGPNSFVTHVWIWKNNAGANFVINGDGSIGVFTFNANNAQDTTEAAFMLIVY